MKKPHILFFDLVTTGGGTEYVKSSIASGLANDYRFSYIDGYDNPNHHAIMASSGAEAVSIIKPPTQRFIGGAGKINRLLALMRAIPWMWRLGRHLKHWAKLNRPDLVYFNQRHIATHFAQYIPIDIPIIYHAHGFSSPKDVSKKLVHNANTRFATVLAVSQVTANRLISAGVNAEKVHVVHNAIDIARTLTAAKEQKAPLPEPPDNTIIVVHPAALAENKCQDVAIKALSKLPENVHLWFAGRPGRQCENYISTLENLTHNLGLEERVHFLGWRNDLPFVLEKADIAILPSLAESFGLVLAEAMLMGTPCVASRTDGIPEVVDENETGLLCSPGDPDSLASALDKLVGNPPYREQMGQKGAARVRKHFSLPRQINEVKTHIERAIANCKSHG